MSCFLLLSVAAHAAVLVPLSGYLPALLDTPNLDSNTVLVSISISNTSAKPDETGKDGGDAHHPQAEHGRPRNPVKRHQMQLDPAVALSSDAPQFVESRQQASEAAPEPVHKQLPVERELVAEPPPETVDDFAATPSKSVQSRASVESEARRNRMVRAEERYLAELLNAISRHRSYPIGARRKGHQGQVEVDLTILRSGEFKSIKISKRSDHSSLDKASTRALSRLKRFKPFPSEIKRETWHLSIPFRYVLNAKAGNNS